MTERRLILGASLLLSACAIPPPAEGTGVSVVPRDLSTGDVLSAEVWMSGVEQEVEISVVRWPDGADVGATVTGPVMDPETSVRRFAVVPAATLEPGWYAVRVRALGEVELFINSDNLMVEPGRVAVSRFGLGQAPRWTGARTTAGGRIDLRFSEDIIDDGSHIQVSRAGIACTPGARHPGAVDHVVFQCPAEWPATVAITITSGLLSVRGPEVVPVDVEQLAGPYDPVEIADPSTP